MIKKKSFHEFKSSWMKSSLQLYLNIVRNLTLRYLYFFKKTIKTHCVESIQIRSFFWSVFSCILYFHSVVFNRLSECMMKLFPRSFVPVTQALKPPECFRLLLREKHYAQTKPWIRHC